MKDYLSASPAPIHIPLFNKYISSLATKNGRDVRFLKNWNVKSHRCHQGMGRNNVKKIVGRACKILRISPEGFTSHFWLRSAATNLADASVSFINLKRHGQWASDIFVEGYIANSKHTREGLEQCLLPERTRH